MLIFPFIQKCSLSVTWCVSIVQLSMLSSLLLYRQTIGDARLLQLRSSSWGFIIQMFSVYWVVYIVQVISHLLQQAWAYFGPIMVCFSAYGITVLCFPHCVIVLKLKFHNHAITIAVPHIFLS